jgi:DNA polymerase (family 10)
VVPELVGLGRYLGLSAPRVIEIARALRLRTADELREAAAAGRLREVPGIGPAIEARIVAALARETDSRAPQGMWLNRARELTDGVARALQASVAGDVRRWCDSCHRLAVVRAAANPEPVLDQFAQLPQIVAVLSRGVREVVGVTVDGVPLTLTVPEPGSAGTALVRATGSPEYVAALEPLPAAADEQGVYTALGVPWCPPELREAPFRDAPPSLVGLDRIRGDLHCHTTWSDGRASDLRPHPGRRGRTGSDGRRCAPPG